MPTSRQSLEIATAVVFILALLLEGSVLYFVEDRILRLDLGLLILVLAVWSVVWLHRRYQERRDVEHRPHRRRQYLHLRGRVRQLLDEVRRLNWAVVDAERGIRTRDSAMVEIDEIEDRLHGLIVQIRGAAGRLTPSEGIRPEDF